MHDTTGGDSAPTDDSIQTKLLPSTNATNKLYMDVTVEK